MFFIRFQLQSFCSPSQKQTNQIIFLKVYQWVILYLMLISIKFCIVKKLSVVWHNCVKSFHIAWTVTVTELCICTVIQKKLSMRIECDFELYVYMLNSDKTLCNHFSVSFWYTLQKLSRSLFNLHMQLLFKKKAKFVISIPFSFSFSLFLSLSLFCTFTRQSNAISWEREWM